jgi:hypothetical protein
MQVMTIDQIEGGEPMHENWDTQLGEELDEVGDPPRVWCASLDKPGCAFTRSIGDRSVLSTNSNVTASSVSCDSADIILYCNGINGIIVVAAQYE